MEETKLIQVLGGALGGGALAGALLLIVYRITSRVVERMIAGLDRVAAAVDAHTKVDLEHHAEVRESVIRLEAKFDSARDWLEHINERTPTDAPARRNRTNPHGHRPPRGNDE